MNLFRAFINFLKDVLRDRRLIWDLTKRDFSSKYLGSYIGFFWAFLHPTITILIFWYVFQVGFRTAAIDDHPFVLWLIAGIIPWFYFSEVFGGGTTSVVDNSFLVKKVLFKVSTLPIIKILSAFWIHVFFIFAAFLIAALYGYYPSIYSFQVFYYLLCMLVLLLGTTWLTSAIYVYIKDMGQLVSIFIQFGFWTTPIFWNIKTVSEEYSFLFRLNPMYYIVEGYRNSIIYKTWFWEDMQFTIIFWVITLFFLVLGILVFKRLRPHFSDVL